MQTDYVVVKWSRCIVTASAVHCWLVC